VIVLDTNVVSELMRPGPAPAVVGWVRGCDARELQTTAITVAEIGYGIRRLADGQRRDRLQSAADELFGRFANQVLTFDIPAAEQYASLVTERNAPVGRSTGSTRRSPRSAWPTARRWPRATPKTSRAPA